MIVQWGTESGPGSAASVCLRYMFADHEKEESRQQEGAHSPCTQAGGVRGERGGGEGAHSPCTLPAIRLLPRSSCSGAAPASVNEDRVWIIM